MDESEQVSLKVKQFFSSLADAKLIVGVTAKMYETLQQQVEKRLTPELATMYATIYDAAGNVVPGEPEPDSRSMVVFTEMRQNQRQLAVVSGFVQALIAQDGPEASAEALHGHYIATKAADIEVTSFVLQMIISRGAKEFVARKEWQHLFDEIDGTRDSKFDFKSLGIDDKKALQKKLLFETMTAFAKVEPDRSKKESCTKVADALTGLRQFFKALPLNSQFIMDEVFKKECDKVGSLLFAHELTDEGAIATAEQARDSLVTNKFGIFYKVVTVYATGIAFRTEAERFFERIHADKGFLITLNEIAAQIDTLEMPQNNHACKSNFLLDINGEIQGVRLPQEIYLLGISKKFMTIKEKSSSLFKSNHKVNLDKVASYLDIHVQLLQEAAFYVMEQRIKVAANKTRVILGQHTVGEELAEVHARAICTAWQNVCPVLDKDVVQIKDIAGKEVYEKYVDKAAEARSMLTSVRKAVEYLPALCSPHPDLLCQQCKDCLSSFEFLKDVCTSHRFVEDCILFVTNVHQHFAAQVRVQMCSALASIEPFLKGMATKKPVDEVLQLAPQSRTLRKTSTDEDESSDPMNFVVRLADVALANFQMPNIDQDLMIGETSVPLSMAVIAPRLFRAARATHEVTKLEKNSDLPESLELHFSVITELMDSGFSSKEDLSTDAINCFNDMASHIEKQIESWMKDWIARMLGAVDTTIAEVVQLLQNDEVKLALKEVRHEQINKAKVLEALDADGVVQLHEALY